MEPLRVAVIGCGRISVRHLDSARDLETAELVAVCDINLERASAAAEKYNANAYTDYREMFEKEKLDAVHICLPHDLHTEVARYAFLQGVHVICEKPISIDYKDAADTVALAEKSGLQYAVVFQCRYNTPSQLVKKRITDGRLGDVKCARVVLTWSRSDDYYSSSNWKGTWEHEGGGVVIDQVIHSLDLANWFIDSVPVNVQSTLHNRHHQIMKVEDTAEGLVEYENGCLLSFFAMNTYLVNEPIEIRLICENGTARLSYQEAIIEYSDSTKELVQNAPQRIVSYTGGKEYWGLQHAVQIDQFYKSVLGIEKLENTGAEALKLHRIICDIYENDDAKLKEKHFRKM